MHSTQHTGRGEISQLQVTHIESDIGQQLGISGWIAAIAIHMAIGNMALWHHILKLTRSTPLVISIGGITRGGISGTSTL